MRNRSEIEAECHTVLREGSERHSGEHTGGMCCHHRRQGHIRDGLLPERMLDKFLHVLHIMTKGL